ncbi:hypothetical protein CROQUDRAFT_580304 [Cronartium quercuum f. sp. fusiforme G11]|uniref:DUF1748-domain-containing protein n=1 Tax=Cronartium quercuum f. sp. fusiforme G11 TaxID=708437 RepID=A0A9P6NKK5_9BASI|nr:hypothetical protein CROQUDRAFT_580304 [Cronartium quercuum f. sp. fusiforme G11]
MVVGRLTHYAFDLALITTVLAGVRRNTGYCLKTKDLPEGAAQSVATGYLQVGETIFDYISAYSHTSTYFFKDSSGNSSKPPNSNGGFWSRKSS